ncbi:MAG: tRNA (adenosine(37)-N6)-threonylcarbamoyltransferase complex dimerization subunit type 1 TsaB [Ruthenibacterium sp.]
MILFALDSAGKTAGVCLVKDDAVLYESYLATGHTHSETLLTLCDAAFCATNLTPADVTVFAANAGPGSFTGLRIGLAALKGLAFPFDTPCAPVSTLSALAYSAVGDGIVATALDARRGEVYCAAFRLQNGNVTRLTADAALPAATFAAQLAAYHAPVRCMGDGAALVCAADASIALYPAAYRLGRANGICRAAKALYDADACVAAAQLSPDYHRLSQAQRERAERTLKGDKI